MFGLAGNKEHKKAATKISSELHRQIREAVRADEIKASARVASLFTLGYLYGFIRLGFINQGFQDEQLTQKYFKSVCKDIPGNFYKVIFEQCNALDSAIELGNKKGVALYEAGLEAGIHDADRFSTSTENAASNLFQYLSNEPLDLKSRTAS